MPPGKIIFLNGTSSAGKTTLAYALQETLSEPYIHVALDQFRDGLPAKYRGLNASSGTTGALGLNVIPVKEGDSLYTDIKFGSQGKVLLKGMRRAMASMVEAGNNIVIDDIILENEFLTDYVEVFRPFDVLFVGVKCPKEVISKRESERPGRFPGTAVGHFEICHAHDTYDVVVDSSTMSPNECAAAITQQQGIANDSHYIPAFHQLDPKRN
ncbi:MAG: chloramphenicol 3-O phosphotransferase [Flavobacterium sp.]|jgi:chloramphenicol 3-O phosphotransferase